MNIPYKLYVLRAKLLNANCGPLRKAREEWRCRCPAHDDKSPSLYVGATKGKILIRCNAGCTAEQICNALDHDQADLFYSPQDGLVDWETGAPANSNAPPPAEPSAPVTTEQPATVADDSFRNTVYLALLQSLELTTGHFEALRKRGLSGDEIQKRGYRSIDSVKLRQAVDPLLVAHGKEKLLTVPGFAEKDDKIYFSAGKGFFIPVRNPSGDILALKIRHDANANGSKYSWASSADVSCGNLVHVPLGLPKRPKLVRLTEGELKADIATVLSKTPTISAPGVGNWPLAVPVLKSMQAKKVLLAMDQDGKPGTLAAIDKALLGLTAEGFEVQLEWWDGNVAKGIDDLLAAGGKPEIVDGLQAVLRVREALLPADAPPADESEPEPPTLPLAVFPPALAKYLKEVGESTGTPPDFAALGLIITAGAAIGNSRALCLKPNIWYESPRFYGANVGDPASGKTPALDAVVKPYQDLQMKLVKAYKSGKSEYDKAKADYEETLKENKILPPEQRKALPDVPQQPLVPERFVVMDCTIESLAPLLEANPRGLLMPQDESVAWTKAMGQYKGGRGNDRQFWLSAWSGKSHLVDRKSQEGVPTSIPRPFVNVVGGLPPDMLTELGDSKERNDGFLHRILFVFPHVVAGAEWSESTVSEKSKAAWEKTLVKLRELEMIEMGDGFMGYQVVKLSPAAREAWVEWYNGHAAETRSPDLAAQMIGPWGKLKAYAARLALVLHYLWLVQGKGKEGDLEAATIERTVKLIDYFKGHLKLVYGRLRLTAEDNHLLEVIDWIRRHNNQCTARDLVRAKKVTPASKAKKFMIELQERGYGRLESVTGGNGRLMQRFVLDPS
jgi:hypothetical protein